MVFDVTECSQFTNNEQADEVGFEEIIEWKMRTKDPVKNERHKNLNKIIRNQLKLIDRTDKMIEVINLK